MGWKETRVQDERLLLVEEFAAGDRSRAEICRRYGVSRKTGYKWYEQFLLHGLAGLAGHCISRTPLMKRRLEGFSKRVRGIRVGASASSRPGSNASIANASGPRPPRLEAFFNASD